nr:hypothetical protein [Tanacetum cinerariifolium]
TTGQGVCWEVMKGRGRVVEYGGVEQKRRRMELQGPSVKVLTGLICFEVNTLSP